VIVSGGRRGEGQKREKLNWKGSKKGEKSDYYLTAVIGGRQGKYIAAV
jgi:hypothetical protein